ncbi:alpha/beta hydrolase [Pseudonocardia parietis]|uniref:alpha/beta hydrolase n=1 Tax=Pseudonocardia parietis TaxID=570936 RepID=UPI001AEB292A|nr:alpha/beta hydrolase [Pseudonocardia parietis]
MGAAAVLAAAAVALTAGSVLVAGHPAYPVLLLVTALCGAALLWRCGRTPRPGRLRAAGRIGGAVLLALLVPVVLWLRPYGADDAAVAAARPSATVDVVHTPTTWELRPRDPTAPADRTGLVFQPGARVDPRAYLPLLRPLAERGVPVVVVAPAFGLALADPGSTARVIDDRPGITTWVVGGHSMGGVAAALALDTPDVRGLVLWASYPAGDVSDAPVAALSVSGSHDALVSPADITASRPLLPPGTRFVEIPGGVHAFFGDYGEQTGDGVPGIDRDTAQQQIVNSTSAFVRAVRPG